MLVKPVLKAGCISKQQILQCIVVVVLFIYISVAACYLLFDNNNNQKTEISAETSSSFSSKSLDDQYERRSAWSALGKLRWPGSKSHSRSSSSSFSSSSSSSPFKSYLLINRHGGVADDIRYVATRFNFTFSQFDSSVYFDKNERFKKDVHHADFMSEQEADSAVVKAVADEICGKYDIVIVADINPDVRFLLQRIDHSPETCGVKKVVILSTQRFDFHLNYVPQDSESKMRIYHNMIKRVTNRSIKEKVGPEIIWVANSPFEIKYSEEKLGEKLPYTLIRPFGFSSIKPKAIDNPDAVVMSKNHAGSEQYDLLTTKLNMSVVDVSANYGGPKTLNKYKAYIEFPYQVSTMKLYENIAHGVVSLVPSYSFFKKIVESTKNKADLDHYYGFFLVDFDYKQMGDQWYKYIEYWHDDFKPYIYYFESYEHLREILQKSYTEMDWEKNVRERGPLFYAKVRQESLASWSKILLHSN